MMRKFTGLLAALVLTATLVVPSAADARDGRRGYYDRGYHGGHYRDRNRGGDAVAAGAIGLVLGLALGAAASAPPRGDRYCRDNYQRCAPPPPPQGYYNQGYYNQGYAPPPPQQPYYDDRSGSAYDQEYGLEGGGSYDPYYQQGGCTRQERQWDRYANQYVTVDVPC